MKSRHSLWQACGALALVVAAGASVPARAGQHGVFDVDGLGVHPQLAAELGRLTQFRQHSQRRVFIQAVGASVHAFTPTHNLLVEVTEGLSSSTGKSAFTTAFLQVQSVAIDPDSQVCEPDALGATSCSYTRLIAELVTGDIPAADVRISAGAASLQTDLRRQPGLSYTRCVLDTLVVATACTEVPIDASISLAWRRNGDDVFTSDSKTEILSGPLLRKFGGKSQEFSATAAGILLGRPVPAVHQAGLSVSDSFLIEITAR
jgi:hypothetical protein